MDWLCGTCASDPNDPEWIAFEERITRALADRDRRRMSSPHHHSTYIEGCFRCDLSRAEVAHGQPEPPNA